jgi:Na+/proline symporter
MNPSIPLSPGLLLLGGYAAGALVLTWWLARNQRIGKAQFLLANRQLGCWESAFSIAATWIWAPALFLASQKAYTQGIVGVIWFTVPNVLCLILFAFFAERIRQLAPEGFTLSDYMRRRYGNRVHLLYVVQMVGLAACSFAVQLLAGAHVLEAVTGIPFFWVTALLAVIALAYSIFGGLKASVVTDYAQMVVILVVTAVIVPWTFVRCGGLSTLIAGWGGHSGRFGNPFSADGLSVAWSFGVPVTIGLLAGPFGDQSFWQRAFATELAHVRAAFIRGALIFSAVPVLLSLLGFIAAGKGLLVSNPELVNLETVTYFLPAAAIWPMALMLLSGLVSTLDSNLCAVASIAAHDLVRCSESEGADSWKKNKKALPAAWLAMIALAVAGVTIANLPGMKILYLFLFYGTLRASTLLPTIAALRGFQPREKSVAGGILLAMITGLPLFAYGGLNDNTTAKVAGAILTVCLPGAVMWMGSKSRPPD